MVGLGKMGGYMAKRLHRAGHRCVGYDRSQESLERVAKDGDIEPQDTLAKMVAALRAPRAVWLMVPSGKPTEETVQEMLELLSPGDILIDGGNSHYTDTMRRGDMAKEKGVEYVDAGTSGGVWGLTEGYCLMVGGSSEAYSRIEPILQALAPEGGLAHVGPCGAGHYVKMVHNGIEYGMLEAYGEGFEILARGPFDLHLGEIASIWRYGSVVRSWLLDLLSDALKKDPKLEHLRGYVEDSGEGRWTVQEAIDRAVAAPVITLALQQRFLSRQDDTLSNRVIAALRNEFGGHAVKDR